MSLPQFDLAILTAFRKMATTKAFAHIDNPYFRHKFPPDATLAPFTSFFATTGKLMLDWAVGSRLHIVSPKITRVEILVRCVVFMHRVVADLVQRQAVKNALFNQDTCDIMGKLLGNPTYSGFIALAGQASYLDNGSRVSDVDELAVALDPMLKMLVECVAVGSVDRYGVVLWQDVL